MPRKRIYETDAERQKAYRGRVSADIYNLRGLMKKIIALEDKITPQDYEKLLELNRKMDRILNK